MSKKNGLSRSQRKRAVRELIDNRDLEELISWAGQDPNVVSVLVSLLLSTGDLLRWRTIEALGKVSGMMAERDPESVRDLIRRQLWAMNDESGNVPWHAPEAIGEILINVVPLIEEYGTILASFLREEPFERGTHWAVARLARVKPETFAEARSELLNSLDDPDPFIRGHAVLALGAIEDPEALKRIRELSDDAESFSIYDSLSGEMKEISVGDIVRTVLNSPVFP